MITIYLLRHGETTFNADGNRYCGRTDAELTTKGMEQAQRMQSLLRDVDFDAVFSSPLQRARMTAAVASGNRKEVKPDERLIEVDFGLWEGKRSEEFIAENPEAWESWIKDPLTTAAGQCGETGAAVIERLDAFFQDLLRHYDGKTVLIVAHNGVNRLFLAWQLGMPLGNYRRIVQENSSLTIVTLDQHKSFNLLKLNA